MALTVTPAIPASQIVSITPSVLAAGGTALDLNGLILTASTRPPVGQLLSFPDPTSVANYFGATSQEAALGSIYFGGFDNSNKKPGQLLYSQYPWLTGVSAYLRGGSVAALTLAQLQALTGTLSVTIDGVVQSATINLSAATSFSNAAALIANAFPIHGVNQGTYTGSIAAGTLTVSAVTTGPQTAQVTGSIGGTTLTVATVISGTLQVGNVVTGTGITAGTTILSFLSGAGGIGTYQLSNSMVVGTETIFGFAAAGNISVGSVLAGTGITVNTYISTLGTGTGGTGTYTVVPSQTDSSLTFTAYAPAVTYDSLSGGFVITSGTTGAGSTITYATGTLADPLNLRLADGAITSQGAAQGVPATAMNAIAAINQNWAQFMTTFEPVSTDKEAFALWTTGQNNRFSYAMWDTNVLNTGSNGPSPAVGVITAGDYSGISMIYEDPTIDTVGGEIAAFILGYGASIDFTETQGRATAAFKSQTGLAPQIFSGTIARNLLSYGMNFYGTYTTAAEAFTWYYNGSVSGPFLWLDSYLDQIWLNSQLQVELMTLLKSAKSIPYNQAGYGLISAACLDPILAAVNAGVIQPGIPLSMLQIAEVNNSAGIKIDQILSTTGWYLQVRAATPQVRQARGSPPISLWYMDGQSVQQINLASIEVQ